MVRVCCLNNIYFSFKQLQINEQTKTIKTLINNLKQTNKEANKTFLLIKTANK